MDDWKAAYATSTWWSPRWNACHTAGAGWPEGVQLRGDDKQFMYLHGKLCVPEGLLLTLVSRWHSEVLVQSGVEKMLADMKNKFFAKNLAGVVSTIKKG